MLLTLVVVLTVRKSHLEDFHTYEIRAARIMNSHGGTIERVITIPGEINGDHFKEIHIVTFPHERSYNSYKADPALKEFMHLRDQSVIETQILTGEDGPAYLDS